MQNFIGQLRNSSIDPVYHFRRTIPSTASVPGQEAMDTAGSSPIILLDGVPGALIAPLSVIQITMQIGSTPYVVPVDGTGELLMFYDQGLRPTLGNASFFTQPLFVSGFMDQPAPILFNQQGGYTFGGNYADQIGWGISLSTCDQTGGADVDFGAGDQPLTIDFYYTIQEV
jgi:hypothetical protein